jgi:ligand-binding sensor domain-containing protein
MSSRLNFTFVLPALLAAVSSSGGQILSFQNYTSKDGLPANGIRPLFQDSRGYLWIGTAEGVSVYDGAVFTNYRTGDGLSMNHITCITESRISPGVIWIGTQGGGLNVFANGHFAAVQLDSTDASKFVNALMEDKPERDDPMPVCRSRRKRVDWHARRPAPAVSWYIVDQPAPHCGRLSVADFR